MGYLDNSTIVVDAVLTKEGRRLLSEGQGLDIRYFTLSDSGIDYTLWNPDHPSGSAYYGEAIENLPMLQASVHAEYALRNRLMTLSQNTIALPAIELSGLTSTNTLTFKDGDTNGKKVTATIKGYASNAGDSSGLYFVIQDPTVVYTNASRNKVLSGTTKVFLREQDMPRATEYHIGGGGPDWNIGLIPDTTRKTATAQTTVYVVHIGTGAWTSFTVVNEVQQLTRNVLSSATKG